MRLHLVHKWVGPNSLIGFALKCFGFPAKILEVWLPDSALLYSLLHRPGNMAAEKETGLNPETYTHLLPKGVPDFDDYTEEDLQILNLGSLMQKWQLR